LQVIDQASYDAANALNLSAYNEKKAFWDWFKPIDDASKAQRATTIAQGKKIDEPCEYIIKVTGAKCAAWMRAEQARIAEEKRIAEDAARKIAEEEALKAAQILESAGMTSAADAILEAPVVIQKVEIAGPDKAEGVSYRDNYSAEVTDLMTLVKAVAAGKAPITCLAADMTNLNGWARLTKGTEALPGVRVVKSTTQTRRG